MNKPINIILRIAEGITAVSVTAGAIAFVKERVDEKKSTMISPPNISNENKDNSSYGPLKVEPREIGFYEQYIKRPLDCTLATGAAIVFSPILATTAVMIRVKLGSPVLFTQPRPGRIDPRTGKETIFKLYKFRSMTSEIDENGELLPDNVRLTSFGKKLREKSLDELPELLNIIKGDMAVIGPRPQLVQDMVFMNNTQRQRHTVRPGLSGLAQVNGRNGIEWEEKFKWDIKYIDVGITFRNDIKIIIETFRKTRTQEGITDGENATSLNFGDALQKESGVNMTIYKFKQEEARKIINKAEF